MTEDKKLSYEEAIAQLEKILGELEKEDNTLEQSMENYKKGLELYKYCSEILKEAEGEVKVLLGNGKEALYEFDIILSNADVVFVVATLGHGTGTGGAPVIAEHAKNSGKLVIGVVTTPFSWERKRFVKNVQDGIDELLKHCDTVIVISNDDVQKTWIGRVTLTEAFRTVDRAIDQTVRAIVTSITNQGFIDLDLADIASIMKSRGIAVVGIGTAEGHNKAIEAATLAITSPIFKADITRVKNLLVNITGSSDMTLRECDDTINYLRSKATNGLSLMYSVTIDDSLVDKILLSVIAIGVE